MPRRRLFALFSVVCLLSGVAGCGRAGHDHAREEIKQSGHGLTPGDFVSNYAASLAALGLSTSEKACPLLVPLVEEGWVDHPVTAEVLRIYLSEALAEAAEASTLVLGCTHYPLLRPTIEQTLAAMNHPLHIVDSAQATAESAAQLLAPATSDEPTRCTFYATDSIEKFQRLGSVFLGQPLPHVHLIDLGG